MNVELTSMLWGGISGAAVFALGLYWLWDMKPDNAETEWLKSEVKDLRSDLNAERDKRRLVTERVRALEHPPFEPKFGDMVMAELEDRSGMRAAIYLGMRNGMYRVVRRTETGTAEFDTDKVEPLND